MWPGMPPLGPDGIGLTQYQRTRCNIVSSFRLFPEPVLSACTLMVRTASSVLPVRLALLQERVDTFLLILCIEQLGEQLAFLRPT